MIRISIKGISTILITLWSFTSVEAHELTENLSLGGVLSGALQCQKLSDDTAGKDTCIGTVPVQPELTYSPGRHDRLFLKLGFATGNGLNAVSPFIIPPWGADLKVDVENINGGNRDYILEAWYEHVFQLGRRNRLGVTLGIIDATRYLDQNVFANDEYSQFMNPALSNAPNTFFPSYDAGIATEWHIGEWLFSAVYMDVNQYSSTETYSFYGLQAGYRLETELGPGNYRILLLGSKDYVDESGADKQQNDILIISIDQYFGNNVGAFTRLGWRQDDVPVDFGAIYSGGIDIRGAAWGRILDNVGIGLAYLDGGNKNISSSRIAETYYRVVIRPPHLALTADFQYMRDEYIQTEAVQGAVFSLRVTVNF
jgi:porin